MHGILALITEPFKEWRKDNAPQLAAALAYYTIFSISPLIVIALAIAGQFFNSDTVRAQMMAQISGFAGPSTAQFIDTILQNSGHSSGSLIASIISFVVLLVGASGVFNQLQFALDKIWDVPPAVHANLMSNLKNYARSFLLVLGVGFLLLVFLIASAVISSILTSITGPGQTSVLPQVLNMVILFLLMTVLFAMTFRIVPAKEITWGDVGLGAAITSLLFILGRYAISLYLTFSKSSSVYGPAGSLIVLLIWIYYSAQIFLLGAEFTQVYARKYGSHKQSVEQPAPHPATLL
jgi:membrane protein